MMKILQPIEGRIHKTVISPFCQEVFYCYYGEEDDQEDDIKSWDFSRDLQESEKVKNLEFMTSCNWFSGGMKKIWSEQYHFLLNTTLLVELNLKYNEKS